MAPPQPPSWFRNWVLTQQPTQSPANIDLQPTQFPANYPAPGQECRSDLTEDDELADSIENHRRGTMADMTFSDPEIVKHYARCRPAPPDNLINTVIHSLKEKMTTPLQLCVDAGCGSGQNTELYSRHFPRVLGVDVSLDQITAARRSSRNDNVIYRVGPAEQLPVESASVDLVTCNISVHWFHLETFYAEVRRVLKPGGVLACSSYHLFTPMYCGKNLRNILEELWMSIDQYQLKGSHYLTSGLASLPAFSAEEVSYSERKLRVERVVTLADVVEYVNSMGVIKSFREAEGKEAAANLISNYKHKLQAEMGTMNEAVKMTQIFDFCLRMWRKPSVS